MPSFVSIVEKCSLDAFLEASATSFSNSSISLFTFRSTIDIFEFKLVKSSFPKKILPFFKFVVSVWGFTEVRGTTVTTGEDFALFLSNTTA